MRRVLKIILLKIISISKLFFKTLLDLIYPPVCHLCQHRLKENEKLVCNPCWCQIPEINLPSDDLKFFENQLQEISGILAVWEYNDQIRRIIHLFKYNGYTAFSQYIGTKMAVLCLVSSEFKTADYLLPVPLHRVRLRERGYNQSLLLSRQISLITGIECNEKLLKRVRNTKTQTRLNSRKRFKNVALAFKVVNAKSIAGKTIIIVDDIITTGSTIRACAAELLKAGAKKILVLVAVRA